MAQSERDFMASLFANLQSDVFSSQDLSPPPKATLKTPKRLALAPKHLNTPALTTPTRKTSRTPLKHVQVLPDRKQDPIDSLCDGVAWSDFDTDMEDEPKMLLKPPITRNCLRCLVQSVQEDDQHPVTGKLSKTLEVTCDATGKTRLVYLQDDWYETLVKEDDTINIVGPVADDGEVVLSLAHPSNFLILHPDTLITATSVATSVSCARRPLLQDRVRTNGASSEPMLYGNLLHELFQTCLLEHNFSPDFRLATTKKLAERDGTVAAAWELDKDVASIIDEVLQRSAEWHEWAQKFVGNSPTFEAVLTDHRATTRDQSRVCLSDVHDIEEDIWSPALGLKGKIDVSVQARIEGPSASDAERSKKGVVAPFEIKTGRKFAGIEHRAQTMLYTLLMSDRYDQQIDSGLLYYTQSGEVHRVERAPNELRGLIQARNALAKFTKSRVTSPVSEAVAPSAPPSSVPQSDDALWLDFDRDAENAPPSDLTLPIPLDEFKTCRRCYQLDSCMLYRKAVEPHPLPATAQESGLAHLFEQKTEHLSSSHTQFFREWERLVSLEEKQLFRHRKEIWTISAAEREDLGRCLADMSIDRSFATEHAADTSKIHRFTYRLVRSPLIRSSAAEPIGGLLSPGDAIVVSMRRPDVLAIARGLVLDVRVDHVVLGLDHSLTDMECTSNRDVTSRTTYRIDKDELSSGLGRMRDNLAQLFYAEGDHKRRRLIVDLEAPRFDRLIDDLPATSISHLNIDQRSAVERVLRAQDYALILGMPGTGKTTTIAEIIAALVVQKKSVLLTSYTHSAVDNILLKLLGRGIDILRLGHQDKILPQVQHLSMSAMPPATSARELDDRFMTPQVVATTALSINHPLFAKRTFDYCIVDEASQITLPAALGPLRFAETFVLVGDHHQLPPLIRNPIAKAEGYETSLFKLLSDRKHAPAATVELKLQYRMNEDIMHISSGLYYDNKLACGSQEVASQRLLLPSLPKSLARLHGVSDCDNCWLERALDPARPVVFLNTDNLEAKETKHGRLVTNGAEANLLAHAVKAFIDAGVPPENIGVIALYRQQIKLLSQTLAAYKSVEVLTADQSQGRDKSVILISFTRSNDELASGDLLKDWRRLNVCFTRAKTKLVMVGSRSTLAQPLKELFVMLDKQHWTFDLQENALEQHKSRKRLLDDPINQGGHLTKQNVPSLL